MAETFPLSLDGRAVRAHANETLFEIAKREGTLLPHLCHADAPGYRADGNCRACLVEIEGERTLAASCIRKASPGMVVRTTSDKAVKTRAMMLEMLAANMPARDHAPDPQAPFWHWHAQTDAQSGRLPKTAHGLPEAPHGLPEAPHGQLNPGAPNLVTPAAAGLALHDSSHIAMVVNLEACIACGLCVRACRDVQANDVIGMAYRGAYSRPVFDLADPMGESTCVACGECVQICPTGALLERTSAETPAPAPAAPAVAETQTPSVCPYCGVGCLTTLVVRDDHIIRVDGRDGPANENRLCVKGRFGQDYPRHPSRLTVPLIRRSDAPKAGDAPGRLDHFREASWAEAMAHAAKGFGAIKAAHGPRALAGFGSAKGSNEEAYLFQKLVRTGFGSNNVDHCTRLCHASSVAALLEGVGSGAVSAPFTAVADADVIVVIGARPTENHPVAASYFKQAAKAGKTLIVLDPRGSALMRHAAQAVRFKPGADVALLNAMLNTIVSENLYNADYIEQHVEGFEEFARHIAPFTPQAMAPHCGVSAEQIRIIARLYAKANAAMIFWGMGVSQHVHGTDNARCLIALALLTGQIGRPGTGLHPLRGQNNVQGASDAGLIPMFYPDYQSVENAPVRARFEAAWGTPLDPERGLTVVEILNAAQAGTLRGLFVMGENPAMSDPDQIHARQALAKLEHLVVQDIFFTETAWHADVIFPASAHAEKLGTYTNTNRQVQLGRPALKLPGMARRDLDLLVSLAHSLGLGWDYGHTLDTDGMAQNTSVEAVYEEMRALMPSLAGLPFKRIEAEDSVTYPAPDAHSPGQAILFTQGFPRPGGKARLVPAGLLPPDEVPDAAFPLVLTTGRLLEHWHTGSMTRRTQVLDALEPEGIAAMHPAQIARMGLAPGMKITVETRRGALTARLRADSDVAEGMVFVPFAFQEAAANRLTNPALDPFGKIPEFKFAAARVCAA